MSFFSQLFTWKQLQEKGRSSEREGENGDISQVGFMGPIALKTWDSRNINLRAPNEINKEEKIDHRKI